MSRHCKNFAAVQYRRYSHIFTIYAHSMRHGCLVIPDKRHYIYIYIYDYTHYYVYIEQLVGCNADCRTDICDRLGMNITFVLYQKIYIKNFITMKYKGYIIAYTRFNTRQSTSTSKTHFNYSNIYQFRFKLQPISVIKVKLIFGIKN